LFYEIHSSMENPNLESSIALNASYATKLKHIRSRQRRLKATTTLTNNNNNNINNNNNRSKAHQKKVIKTTNPDASRIRTRNLGNRIRHALSSTVTLLWRCHTVTIWNKRQQMAKMSPFNGARRRRKGDSSFTRTELAPTSRSLHLKLPRKDPMTMRWIKEGQTKMTSQV